MAKMDYYPVVALKATVRHYTGSQAGRQQLLDYRRPQELVNLFWVFARCGHDPGEEMLRLAGEAPRRPLHPNDAPAPLGTLRRLCRVARVANAGVDALCRL